MIMRNPAQRTTRAIQRSRSFLAWPWAPTDATFCVMAGTVADCLVQDDLVRDDIDRKSYAPGQRRWPAAASRCGLRAAGGAACPTYEPRAGEPAARTGPARSAARTRACSAMRGRPRGPRQA